MENSMRISDYLRELNDDKRKVKILHYNAEDNKLKMELAAAGYDNYLAVVSDISHSFSGYAYPVNSNDVIFKNNADVLILGKAGFDDIKKAFNSSAELIVFKPNHLVNNFSFLAVWAYKYARKRRWEMSFKEFAEENGAVSRGILFRRKYKKEKKARYYLSPETPLDSLFKCFNEQRLRYVVLRWFDKIPFSDIQEDVDLLVANEDIFRVQQVLNEKIGILPFDLYSVSGLPGSSFKNMAYYPPNLAEKILAERTLWKGRFFVPDKRHYFLSLLYHAVYHKGIKSGIPVRDGDLGRQELADHEYLNILQALAKENNMELKELNLMYFHRLLGEAGWAPATDTIRKLPEENASWLKETIIRSSDDFEKSGEVMVFVIRDWAYKRGLTGFIINWLEKSGLNLVKAIELNREQKRQASQRLRGGNWGQGPWPVNGGDPAVLLVMYDYHPKPLKEKFKKKYPHVSNEHYLFKEEVRREINSNLEAEEKTNPIHSSDDEIEALDYINMVVPETMAYVRNTITEWDKAYVTKEKVYKDLSGNRRRAKVEVIEYQGKKAVKKTYQAGKERFLKREVYVYGELSKECEFIPKLLDSGDNYLIVPLLDTLRIAENKRVKKWMLKKYKEEILGISRFFYEKGFALIDFHPGNILMTKEGPRIIDFEFLYKYDHKPKTIDESFDFIGYPDNFMADIPYGIDLKSRKDLWKKILY